MQKHLLRKTLLKAYFGNRIEIKRALNLPKQNKANVIQGEFYYCIYHPKFNYDGELGLFVEFATSTKIPFKEGIDYLVSLARSADAKFIQFKTKRKGVVKLSRQLGFDVISRHKDTFTINKEV